MLWWLLLVTFGITSSSLLENGEPASSQSVQKNYIGPEVRKEARLVEGEDNSLVIESVKLEDLRQDDVGRLAFSLAERDISKEEEARRKSAEKRGGFMRFMEEMATNPMLKKMLSFVQSFTGSALDDEPQHHLNDRSAEARFLQDSPIRNQSPLRNSATPERHDGRSHNGPIATSQVIMVRRSPQSSQSNNGALIRTPQQRRFVMSEVNDQPPMVTSTTMTAPQMNPASHARISDQEWSKTLFGERGVLTEIFHAIDEQRRAAEVNGKAQTPPPNTQSDISPKINGNFDFMKMFESLLKGPKAGEFGDPGPELPEFLGICNRLSCGDIYKAIDQFRRSEFFSNFQTALSLVQDPKGWEIIGKALENPELISEFASTTGLQEMLGSAIGEKKKETDHKKTDIVPEDGDFGTDFSEMVDGTKPKNKPTGNELPELSFSTDEKEEKSGGDYYNQVSSSVDVDVDSVDTIDVEVPKQSPAPTTSAPTTPTSVTEYTSVPGLPELSFSIDENEEFPEQVEEFTIEKSIDVVPPGKLQPGRVPSTAGNKLSQRIVQPVVATSTTTTTTITTRTTTRRTTTAVTRPTTTMKNFRKDNDYYAMYYADDRA